MSFGVRVRFRSQDGVRGERVLQQLPVRLGRSVMNDCTITHPFVSDFHASIEMTGGELCVRDLNSRNGVYDRSMARLPAGRSVPLSALGGFFIMGRAVEVEIEAFEDRREPGLRSPTSIRSSVLGNPAALGGSLPALPPLSMASPGAVAPPPRLPLPSPGNAAAMSIGQGLPSLAPIGGLPLGSLSPQNPQLPSAYPPGGSPSYPPAQPRPSAPAASASTQNLAMSMELLALVGIRELAASLVPGARLETTGDVARLLTKVHDLLDVFCRCFVPLRNARLGTRYPSAGANVSETTRQVETSNDPAALASALLDWRSRDFDGPEAIERVLNQVAADQASLLDGILPAVGALLDELSPDEIERNVRDEGSSVFGRHRAFWQAYRERFEQVSQADRRAEILFGPELAVAFRRRAGGSRG